MLIKTIKQANQIVGGLSTPSKMPGYGYSLPAEKCKTGSKLRKVKGSVCSECYGCKGRYCFDVVQNALWRRYNCIRKKHWVIGMSYLINARMNKCPEFRWHDVGDVQNRTHLNKIIKVCRATPEVAHWLPTKEYDLIKQFLREGNRFPANLCVRLSVPIIGQKPKKSLTKLGPTSTVNSACGYQCPVKSGEEGCDDYDCRACWDPTVKNVDYRIH